MDHSGLENISVHFLFFFNQEKHSEPNESKSLCEQAAGEHTHTHTHTRHRFISSPHKPKNIPSFSKGSAGPFHQRERERGKRTRDSRTSSGCSSSLLLQVSFQCTFLFPSATFPSSHLLQPCPNVPSFLPPEAFSFSSAAAALVLRYS